MATQAQIAAAVTRADVDALRRVVRVVRRRRPDTGTLARAAFIAVLTRLADELESEL